jgi:hypothetical protein
VAPAAALVSFITLLTVATPAGAATTVILAAKPWHYWISIVLVASVVVVLLALVVGYVWRVTTLKHGMREGTRK